MDDQRQTRVGKEKDRFRMSSRSLSRSPHLSFSSTSIPIYFIFPLSSVLSAISRCQISLAPFSVVFLPVSCSCLFFPSPSFLKLMRCFLTNCYSRHFSSIMNFWTMTLHICNPINLRACFTFLFMSEGGNNDCPSKMTQYLYSIS